MTTGRGSRAQKIASLNSKGSANSSRFVPPFYLSLPGLPEESDQTGFDTVLESSRSGVALGARTRLTGSGHSRPDNPSDRDEDLEVGISPVASATDHYVEEQEELGRPEVGLRRKVLEGDFNVSHKHLSTTIGFYIHSTSG